MGFSLTLRLTRLPDTSFTEIPVFAPYEDEEKDEIIRWARRLDSEKGTIACPGVAAASLLALLPEEFTASDLIKLRARKGQSVKASAVSMVLNRWRNNHRIVKINETTWRKTNY